MVRGREDLARPMVKFVYPDSELASPARMTLHYFTTFQFASSP